MTEAYTRWMGYPGSHTRLNLTKELSGMDGLRLARLPETGHSRNRTKPVRGKQLAGNALVRGLNECGASAHASRDSNLMPKRNPTDSVSNIDPALKAEQAMEVSAGNAQAARARVLFPLFFLHRVRCR